jgi:hypothetical protein
MTNADQQIVNRAIGRIFLLGSRPEQTGDAAQYELCRKTILDLVEADGFRFEDRAPCYVRDRLKGAQGD